MTWHMLCFPIFTSFPFLSCWMWGRSWFSRSSQSVASKLVFLFAWYPWSKMTATRMKSLRNLRAHKRSTVTSLEQHDISCSRKLKNAPFFLLLHHATSENLHGLSSFVLLCRTFQPMEREESCPNCLDDWEDVEIHLSWQYLQVRRLLGTVKASGNRKFILSREQMLRLLYWRPRSCVSSYITSGRRLLSRRYFRRKWPS